MSPSIWYDKKSKWFFARYRNPDPNATPKFPAVKLTPRCDQYRSRADVKKHPRYLELAQQLMNGNGDSVRHKLLFAVADARNHSRPDADDRAMVERMTADDAASTMLLTTFVESIYWPHVERKLRAQTVAQYKSIWQRYKLNERVGGLRIRDFRTKHGAAALQAVAAEHSYTLGKRTLQHVKHFLSGVFVLARNTGHYELANPVRDVFIPQGKPAGDTYAYELDEIRKMLGAAGVKEAAAIGIAAYAGLRESEISGLHWNDFETETQHESGHCWATYCTQSRCPATPVEGEAVYCYHYTAWLSSPSVLVLQRESHALQSRRLPRAGNVSLPCVCAGRPRRVIHGKRLLAS